MSKQAAARANHPPSCIPLHVQINTLDWGLAQDPQQERDTVQELVREDYFHLGRPACPSDEWAEFCF